jgi:hypothetical protein
VNSGNYPNILREIRIRAALIPLKSRKIWLPAIWHGSCTTSDINRGTADHDDQGSKTMFDFTSNDARRILLAMAGGLLMSLACLMAALAPANAASSHCVDSCRPTLL